MRKIFLSLLCILWLSGCKNIAEKAEKITKSNDDYIIIRLPNDELVYGRGTYISANESVKVYLHGGKTYRVHASNVAIIGEWEDDE